MTDAERQATLHEVFGGEEGVRCWHAAFAALRDFAKASGCPLGEDIREWFEARTQAYSAALAAREPRSDVH